MNRSKNESPFADFRQKLNAPDHNALLALLRKSLIGEGIEIPGLIAPVPLVYADYVASGRALTLVEDFIQDSVLPYYSNSHTTASFCGAYISSLRTEAREIIKQACGASDEYDVIFTGSGATSGLNRLVNLFGIHQAVSDYCKPLILVGPYEHHSNILPWRESGAEVIEVGESKDGGPDLEQLESLLRHNKTRTVVGAFSAASNVTGIISDTRTVTKMLKKYGAKVVWDFAGAAPYLPINAVDRCEMDALVISPHKFIGGPGASGVLIVKRAASEKTRPCLPGGGTVKFVSPWNHDYSDNLVQREEGGTPNVVGDIRAALAFIVKDAIGEQFLADRQKSLCELASRCWEKIPQIDLLGNQSAQRLPIFSMRIKNSNGDGYVHQQLFTRMLSDVYGIQARGGCACAGPYAHRILGITKERSEEIRAAINSGNEIEKPGWTRLNLSVLLTAEKAQYIIDSVSDLALHSDRYIKHYRCDETLAQFQIKDAA